MGNLDVTVVAVPVSRKRASHTISLLEECVYTVVLGAGEGAIIALAVLSALGW